ncbi:helix-turn-helix transcriptional regulator [Novosphingobium sp. FSW06-99]|uniref:helix-turn-helix transcriptional regulator n=1 Tax=Novosphingobium sp. FSW06-99 TaxID=1739113 RepID=UPI000AD50F01|nr:helix-turn-helix transcriptional regulator [Novosphingobium sp. FSW06-99]
MSGNVLHFPAMDLWPNRIREFRQARGISQQQLADLIHVSKMTISSLERGNIEFSLDYARRIAQVFGVTAVDLLNDEDQNAFLRAEEMELVRRYRAADPLQREMIDRVAEPRIIDIPDPDAPTAALLDRATVRSQRAA